MSAGAWGVIGFGAAEDFHYMATDIGFWNTWHFQPLSFFVGTLSFLAVLYLLLHLNGSKRPLRYLEPYTPLLGASGANLALKLNAAWLVPVTVFSVAWSVIQVRNLSERQRAHTRARV